MNTVNSKMNILISTEANYLNLESYLEVEFMVSGNGGGIIANNADVRLVNYGVMALFSFIKLGKISGKTIEYIDHCYPNLLLCKLLTRTSDEYISGFFRDRRDRDNQLKGDQQAALRGHLYMMIKIKDLFGFVNDLEKILYGIGFKLKLKRNSNDRAFFRVDARAGAVANDCNIEIRDIACCVPCIVPSNDQRIIIQKGLNNKNNIDFSFYERKTFYKNIPDATNFLFDIGVESGFEIPQYTIVSFENHNVDDQTNHSSILIKWMLLNAFERLVV